MDYLSINTQKIQKYEELDKKEGYLHNGLNYK